MAMPKSNELRDAQRWHITNGPTRARSRLANRAEHIPGLINQPERTVRRAYWQARRLIDGGWRIEAIGLPIAQYGFIAEIPNDAGDTTLVVYPPTNRKNDSAAAALSNTLRRLTPDQRRSLNRILDALHGRSAIHGAPSDAAMPTNNVDAHGEMSAQ
jgi:hypothetical protein